MTLSIAEHTMRIGSLTRQLAQERARTAKLERHLDRYLNIIMMLRDDIAELKSKQHSSPRKTIT